MNKGLYTLFILLVLLLPVQAFSQVEDTLMVTSLFGTGQYLNAIIAADTSGLGWQGANGQTAWQNRTRVYVLKMNGLYPVNTVITLNAARKLKIRAEYGVPAVPGVTYKPYIALYPAAGGGNPPGQFVNANGANDTIVLENIMLAGYNELVPANLDALQGSLLQINTSASGSIFVDGCILKSINGQIIRTAGRTNTVRVTNSIFADMGFLGTSNFGAGKGLDLRNVEVDTVDIRNNTFVNWIDRIVRHYLSTSAIHNFIFNHNTCVSGLSYHGFLSLGILDATGAGTFQIKNNLLIDHFALGADTDVVRQAEFADPAELDTLNANYRMTWVSAIPNTAVNWDISNNYYAISDSGAVMRTLNAPTFMGSHPYVGHEDPFLPWGMNKRLAAVGGDSVNCFRKVTAKVARIPTFMTKMIRWYYTSRANGGAGKEKRGASGVGDPNFTHPSAGVWTYDNDRRTAFWYADSLNCNFDASVDLSDSASDGGIIGDPRWSFVDLGVVGVGSSTTQVPKKFTLEQNYPNPFNPSTNFTFELSKAGLVSIKVFDILGREVATLVNEFKQAGSYPVTWNAASFSSGVYFYKMQSGSFSETRKMILMK